MGAPLANAGKVTHVNGSAGTVAAETEKQGSEPAWLVVNNPDATNSLLVSFDGGKLYFTIKPNTKLEGPLGLGLKSLWLKSSAGTIAYEILWTSVV